MSGLIVPGPAPLPPTRTWGGVYSFDAAEVAQEPGHTEAEEAAQRRVRNSARQAGHKPVGGVTLDWTDRDPGDPDAEPVEGKAWIRAAVEVIPNGETVTIDQAEVQALVQRYSGPAGQQR